ncbi:hypothetical protein CPB85DRAFT_1441134 [Mucidula mucida]|nr:hypothetical protein CPB85DRAFT_1441134 [Mucidula mucida]
MSHIQLFRADAHFVPRYPFLSKGLLLKDILWAIWSQLAPHFCVPSHLSLSRYIFMYETMTESQQGFEQQVAQFMQTELEWIGIPPQTTGIVDYLKVLESAEMSLDALAPSGVVAFAQAHIEMALRTPALTLVLITNLVFYISLLHNTARFAGSHILLMEGDNGPNIVRTRRIIWKMALARAIFWDLVRRGAPYNLPTSPMPMSHLPSHVIFKRRFDGGSSYIRYWMYLNLFLNSMIERVMYAYNQWNLK